jgi:hypothetical protein
VTPNCKSYSTSDKFCPLIPTAAKCRAFCVFFVVKFMICTITKLKIDDIYDCKIAGHNDFYEVKKTKNRR